MATRTVSAAGGNFGVTTTWVGGVVPVANDDIIADSTSGNLTLVGSTPALTGANFTGYTGTLAFGTGQMSIVAGSTVTLSSTMTLTSGGSAGRFQFSGSSTISVVSGVCRVPWIGMGGSGTLTITGSGELYIAGFNNNMTTTGNNFTFYGTSAPSNVVTVTSPQLCFIRPDTTVTFPNNMPFSRMVFDTTGTVSTTGSILSTFGVNTFVRFDKTPAFSAGTPISYLITTGALTHTLDVGTSSVKITRLNVGFNSGNLTTSIFLPSNTNIGKMIVRPYFNTSSDGTRHTTQLISNSNVSIDELTLASDYGSFINGPAEGASQVIITNARLNTLRLASTGTYSIGYLNCSGVSPTFSTPTTIFASMTASSPATVSLGNTFSFNNTQIIDINNVGTPAYAFSFANNTLTRTTGFSSTLPSGGTGSGGGSFTYVN